ncbi:uncharacterized protein LOC131529589 [Onychostoma macrolepis]|uniref:MHC class I-like antigen recognition-like domain-containing protein n=1 Tax=Onychostoma macrolepis TaxID=369639 RepID=A0A7J6DE19_9TELE|nr:uncharacterized protein LOC131529589 [Onychostoma macrolepis]KAF4117084.1 hypothetical protein G5714_001637 [Onychostoma macrolepis]
MLEIETERKRTKIRKQTFVIAARASYHAEMLFFVTIAFLVDICWALPTDIIIQFERSVLLNGTVVERILVSEAHLKGQFDKQPVVRPIRDEILEMMVENDRQTASYSTYKRLRECKLRGYRVLQLSDRFQLNGKDFLSLDSDSDSWTVLKQEAQDLKQPWTLKAEHASLEKIHLKEECEEFIKQMNDIQNQEGPGVLRVMAPVLATILFIGFVFMSLLIFKRHGHQPGGVLGSIIHYPAHHLEVPLDEQSQKDISQVPVLKGPYSNHLTCPTTLL